LSAPAFRGPGAPIRETDPRDELVAEALSQTGLAVVPSFYPASQWRALAREARRVRDRGAFRVAGVSRGAGFRVEPEIRSDRVHWIDPSRPTRPQQAWLLRMEALRRALNERLYLGLFGFETHLALYPCGAGYRTHLDRFADTSSAQRAEGERRPAARHRSISVLLYLNEGWRPEHGGALRLYPQPADRVVHRDVEPSGGTLVAFLSAELHHEVLTAARERWSVAGWFTTRP